MISILKFELCLILNLFASTWNIYFGFYFRKYIVFSILEIITLLIEIDIAPLTFCNFPLADL